MICRILSHNHICVYEIRKNLTDYRNGALLVFAGQGGPGQEVADTGLDNGGQMEAGETMEEGDIGAGSEDAFGIAIPSSAQYVDRTEFEDGSDTVRFQIPGTTDVEALHTYFLDEVESSSWELDKEVLGSTSTIQAVRDSETLNIGAAVVSDQFIQVTISKS